MATRECHAYAEWGFSPDDRPGVPVVIFHIECTSCHERPAEASDDGTPQQTWALDHTGRNPDHQGFKLNTETFWRVEPRRDNPYAEIRP
ncbi:hypothetical protein OG735_26340 [Streptomyces sp. NBC_01210]|uniref:DUF7848 domain-containing protein n=1 Tax=Streptomyces sp. NBC_01210 TaxID=2903774 RepID=UPI002E117648|nr:hypothetical protein OG735_26340 [Streptomyces sp. NBC_01210]